MATIKYRIKSTKKDPTSIYARLYIRQGLSAEVKTGLTVNRSDWSDAKSKVKVTKSSASYIDVVNDSLRALEDFFHSAVNKQLQSNKPITNQWLKSIPKQCFKSLDPSDDLLKETYFIDFIDSFIKDSEGRKKPRTGEPISKRTIQDYTTTKKRLKSYEDAICKGKLEHVEIDLNFHRKYVDFCISTLMMTPRTVGGDISNIKLFCKQAKRQGIQICNDFESKDFYKPSNETHDIALREDEMEAISELDLAENDRLDNARDWFVIGLWTGLRVSDLLKLNKGHIEDDFIVNKNKKTGIFVVIPIHDKVRDILDKRGGSFPRKISDQKYNEYIKEVGKLAGLTDEVQGAKKVIVLIADGKGGEKKVLRKQIGSYPKYELISSHIGRRSFATYHYGKLDTLTIMSITGHKTERQFLEYVKINPRQHAERMKAMWNKQKPN